LGKNYAHETNLFVLLQNLEYQGYVKKISNKASKRLSL